MRKEFIPYEEALALKELGYSQEFNQDGIWYFVTLSNGELMSFCWTSDEDEPYDIYKPVIAPLYQQAFRWFREKYKLHTKRSDDWSDEYIHYYYLIYDGEKTYLETDGSPSYEEAELECLRKLIEIVKEI